jgi:hypothetical protein
MMMMNPNHNSNTNSRLASAAASTIIAMPASVLANNNNNTNYGGRWQGPPPPVAYEAAPVVVVAEASTLAARCACAVATAPLLFLGNSSGTGRLAAHLHLLVVPLVAPPLQQFAYRGGRVTGGLCAACLWLGTVASLLLVVSALPPTSLAHALFALALCLGCAQLLLMVHKGHVLRVMACTATAVMVSALALAAATTTSAPLARRFFQMAALPFVLLFLETARGPIAYFPVSGTTTSSMV